MPGQWNNWGKTQYWDNQEGWQPYGEKEANYGWLKKTLIALLVYAVMYGASVSGTRAGNFITNELKYLLTAQTDFTYLKEQAEKYVPLDTDVAVLKKIRDTVTKSADPLLYMAKPVDGKVKKVYGWYTDPGTKEEKLSDGITFEAAAGSVVKAAAQGKVKAVTESAQYGKVVIIEHSQEIDTVYGNLGEVLVKADDAVSQGQIVARVAKPVGTANPELYFEVRVKGKTIDPLTRIRNQTPENERQ
ncbi:MAG: Peptidase [Firmicutes bacterium]|nr:Peptidase [Bacillota bacterium]